MNRETVKHIKHEIKDSLLTSKNCDVRSEWTIDISCPNFTAYVYNYFFIGTSISIHHNSLDKTVNLFAPRFAKIDRLSRKLINKHLQAVFKKDNV